MTKAIYQIRSNKPPKKQEIELLGETYMWATSDAILNIKYIGKCINLEDMQDQYTYYITIYAKNERQCESELDAQIYDGIFENWKLTDEIKLIIRKTI